MLSRVRFLAWSIIFLGIVVVVVGSVFIWRGVSKADFMRERMREEKVTLGIGTLKAAQGEVVDSAEEAQGAANLIRSHRKWIAPTYQDLLAGGQFDPTNPKHLIYAQALNMENYLYLAVLGFGVTTELIASGVFMILAGLALGLAGLAFFIVTRELHRV